MIVDGRSRMADYVTLAKPRLNLLVVASTLAGFVMGRGDLANVGVVLAMAGGTALVAAGASAFNQVIERRTDALMRRTRLRPMAEKLATNIVDPVPDAVGELFSADFLKEINLHAIKVVLGRVARQNGRCTGVKSTTAS